MNPSPFRSRRVVAAASHLFASVAVAGVASILVFAIWYPAPFAAIAAGGSLFLILVSVDVVLGPVLTAIAADPAKSNKVFRRDLAVIIAIQLAGFAYGIYSIALARPVYLVFEVDRMRVVTAADIEPEQLGDAPPNLRRLPWTGPEVIAAVRPTQPDEVLRSIDLALSGIDISLIPKYWRDFAAQKDAALRLSRPATELRSRYPEASGSLQQIAAKAGQPFESLRFLPVVSRQASWVALMTAPEARVVGFLPLDGFF